MCEQRSGGAGTCPAPRIADYGYCSAGLPKGRYNKISDVPGVRVGHYTLHRGRQHTGLTVVLPVADNIFQRKCVAAAYVQNGFGKTCGLVQMEELGTLETPIVLTNTLQVGKMADALVEYTLCEAQKCGQTVFSVNPVVGECNDSHLNEIARRSLDYEALCAAISGAEPDFAEGAVGAGTGTLCYGLKGGIGSASRSLSIGGRSFTLGVLVQTNFGALRQLRLEGEPLGRQLESRVEALRRELSGVSEQGLAQVQKQTSEQSLAQVQKQTSEQSLAQVQKQTSGRSGAESQTQNQEQSTSDLQPHSHLPSPEADIDRGSVMMVLATDLPVDARQLKRLLKRMPLGLARTGCYSGHGSGELMLGFTTANRRGGADFETLTVMNDVLLEQAFLAAVEASEEAVLNSMCAAQGTCGLDGRYYPSLREFLPLPL